MKSMFEQEKIMDYKKLIIEMLDKLCDERYLEYIYQLIKTFLADAQRKGIRKIEKTEFTGRNLRGEKLWITRKLLWTCQISWIVSS